MVSRLNAALSVCHLRTCKALCTTHWSLQTNTLVSKRNLIDTVVSTFTATVFASSHMETPTMIGSISSETERSGQGLLFLFVPSHVRYH